MLLEVNPGLWVLLFPRTWVALGRMDSDVHRVLAGSPTVCSGPGVTGEEGQTADLGRVLPQHPGKKL